MKVGVLVLLIVVPMVASIGLYIYAFVSTRWSYLDETLIYQHNSSSKSREDPHSTNDVQLENRLVRHGFRSRYSLFGYCVDYKWLHLFTVVKPAGHSDPMKMDNVNKQNASSLCPSSCLSSSAQICPQTGCCMNMCDDLPDCPSYIDEKNCNRTYSQTRYYWPQSTCMWQSTWIGHRAFPDYFSVNSTTKRDFHVTTKRLRYSIMFLLFLAAPLLTCFALMILLCINCIERFYSIPFAFVSFVSFGSFLSGAGGLGLFLYEWIHERLYRADYTYEFDQNEAVMMAFNPWIINAERLGLAFWLTVAAVGTSLFTTLLSCCFCCGLQSDKSKLRIHVKNSKYEIVHMSNYDE